jgi:mono/diheme cytochrome c family protein
LRNLFGVALLALAAGAWTNASPLVASPVQNTSQDQKPDASSASVLDGVYTVEQATRGEDLFKKVCESCHSVAEHTGKNFAANWGQSTIGDFFDLISATMPDGDPGSLRPEDYASVIAFFLKQSGYPEGKQEMPATSAALAKIRIQPLP